MVESNANPLETALPRFLRRCDAESTRTAYERELLRFISWLRCDPYAEVLFDYRDHLRGRNLGPTTVRWRTTVARAFLLFAAAHGYIPPGSVGDFKPPRGTSGFAPRVLTAVELQRLLDAPDRRTKRGKRDAAALACLGVGGLRAGEVCRLDAEDVRIEPGRVVLHVDGKGRKQRLVALPGKFGALCRAYLSSWPESRTGDGPELWSRVVYDRSGCGLLLHAVYELHPVDDLGQELVAIELPPSFLRAAA